jgi:hypothetical protein
MLDRHMIIRFNDVFLDLLNPGVNDILIVLEGMRGEGEEFPS